MQQVKNITSHCYTKPSLVIRVMYRTERCLWQIQRGERVAAVKISRANSEQEILGTATGLFQAQKSPDL